MKPVKVKWPVNHYLRLYSAKSAQWALQFHSAKCINLYDFFFQCYHIDFAISVNDFFEDRFEWEQRNVLHWSVFSDENGFFSTCGSCCVNLMQIDFNIQIFMNVLWIVSGSFQPSTEMMLRFYSYYKQATEGKCTIPKPAFWDLRNK